MTEIRDLGEYTFTALLQHSASKFGDRPALGYVGGKAITYNEFDNSVRMLRDRLWSLGVRQGERVAIYAPSCPNWSIAYFAIVTMGAIAVPLLPDFTALEVESCLAHSAARHLIVSEKLLDRISGAGLVSMKSIIWLESMHLAKGEKDPLMATPSIQINEDDTASIIYTSGTTGRSKAVELSHKNLVFTALGGQFFQQISKKDRGLSILPLSHVYEFSIGFLMFFMNGASVWYLDRAPAIQTLLPALKTVRPTIMLSVPIIMEKIYKNKVLPGFTRTPFMAGLYGKPFFRKALNLIAGISLKKTFGGKLKFFGIGGSKLDPKVEHFLKEARFPYAIGYGLTETSPLLAGSGPKITVPGTVGPVMPGVSLKLIDVNPESGIGEVAAKGPNVMKGYYKDPELTEAAFTEDGWLRTGDLGILEDGRLALKGRSKNMIITASGENIYPEDIEFVLNQHPFVNESLVVEGKNSLLIAFIELNLEKLPKEIAGIAHSFFESLKEQVAGKKEELARELKTFVNRNVNKFSRIDRIEFIQQFEKTASQKIKRYCYSLLPPSLEPNS